jgi:hypothetical protein
MSCGQISIKGCFGIFGMFGLLSQKRNDTRYLCGIFGWRYQKPKGPKDTTYSHSGIFAPPGQTAMTAESDNMYLIMPLLRVSGPWDSLTKKDEKNCKCALTYNVWCGRMVIMSRKSRDLADQIRREIKRQGFSGYRLAKASGVSQGVVCRFINGRRDIGLSTASKLAKVLGLELIPKKNSAPASNNTGEHCKMQGR